MKRLACAIAITGAATVINGAATASPASTSRPKSQNGVQLSILTPDPSTIGDQLSLDVVCKGGILDSVELYLDNALVAKRQINTNQTKSIISFKLDTLLMSAGNHDVIVKVYSPDGKSTTSGARIKMPTLDLNSPVRIAYPANGTQVSGIVPIRLSLDSEMQRLRPYVTFFVDKEFKVLRNTPPFEYNWDTTKVVNGWHVVEAWSQSGDNPSPLKARPVHVNVNNGGGETKRQTTIEDLRFENGVDPSTATSSNPSTDLGTVSKSGAITLSGRPQPSIEDSRNSEPSSNSLASASNSASNIDRMSATESRLTRVSPRTSGGAAKQPLTRMASTSIKPNSLPGLIDESQLVPMIAHVTGGSSANTVAVRPGETLDAVAKRTGVQATEIAKLNNVQPGHKPTSKSLIVPTLGSFDVAFDGMQIAFDVAPRVEAGVHIAPFRQIFEHSGGRLYWFGGTAQTVRAVNDSREIEIKIGNKKASVNNKPVSMEKTPFIESGRTIVPLSFVRDSMNVNVSFDEKTGRLLIKSKK